MANSLRRIVLRDEPMARGRGRGRLHKRGLTNDGTNGEDGKKRAEMMAKIECRSVGAEDDRRKKKGVGTFYERA